VSKILIRAAWFNAGLAFVLTTLVIAMVVTSERRQRGYYDCCQKCTAPK
jgi:hypothetical protein